MVSKFNNSKYTKWYFNIINNAVGKLPIVGEYVESHHILPKSMGGVNQKSNIVRVTAKEHFILHHLLTKMCINDGDTNKMKHAFFIMHIHSTENRYFTAMSYNIAKNMMSVAKKKISSGKLNPYYGKKHTEEILEKMRKKRVGRICRLDRNIHLFFHADHGEIRCTQQELYTNYNICRKSVNALIKRKLKSYKGWMYLGVN